MYKINKFNLYPVNYKKALIFFRRIEDQRLFQFIY